MQLREAIVVFLLIAAALAAAMWLPILTRRESVAAGAREGFVAGAASARAKSEQAPAPYELEGFARRPAKARSGEALSRGEGGWAPPAVSKNEPYGARSAAAMLRHMRR